VAKKALAGEMIAFTGISDPYEEPIAPEIVVESDTETVEASAAKIMDELERRGLVRVHSSRQKS
jgi:adenylylsulfate kinase